ncbi:uncharacterized protein K460DRAFT_174362 [Cucurbitaria berberidis CBS 394.84]|uniref:DUF1989 domain-containing protein n=1 Tax=Cucurbitaria berberidis CBS 394.84 TaxID=1168544 RepID=A0A9P4L4B7_9PLEO|nr:uncharacterized protein K460DRAFT_174362 [Cucurbitaria berberidis CBS 394.84]KAF1841836.1 hypothetical protein K460DRAFT_174362 [Cucurbitaria berberidis CBS 394.84]
MSGELQTIPARHGVATFVPRGRTIKVINTYGKQVVSMWAFSLGAPPEEGEDDEEVEAKELDAEEVQQEAEGLKKAVEEGGGKESVPSGKGKERSTDVESTSKETESTSKGKGKPKEDESIGKETQSTSKGKEKFTEAEGTGKETQTTSEASEDDDSPEQDAEDPPEQAPDTPEKEESTPTASSSKQPSKRTWASYLPSIPYRNKGTASKTDAQQKPSAEEEKAQNEENTKKWSSYLPTGKGISNYVPNVQIPDSKGVVSAFKSSHYRDPNKSYAEQLYDFSKTPVGAGTIAAATGSGYASSVYAAYTAYATTHPSNSSMPPMEYLSLPHTRASSYKLVPEVDDELLTNLRNPIITLVEDTSPGAHDTLTAACDANLYTALGIDKPAEHGSCAENLVLALKELNETAGLKGAKAVGADISVNIAPTPLHLFMNAPLELTANNSSEGAGAKGAVIKVEEPKGKKRSFVRFRAERDVVVVFSACPMDVGHQNGGRCMAANFMVEDVQEGEDLATSAASIGKKRGKPKKLNGSAKKADAGPKKPEPQKEEPKKQAEEKKSETPKPDSAKAKPAAPKAPEKEEKKEEPVSEEPKAKKKPKKLQVRGGSSTPAPSPKSSS